MPSKPTIAAVFLLSLGVWIAFRFLTPAAPLTPAETSIVVVICGCLVVGGGRAYTMVRKRRVQNVKAQDGHGTSVDGGPTGS